MNAPNIQLVANNGNVNISTANGNLNGTGAMGTVLTAGSSITGAAGTFIRSITITATGSSTLGVVRLFISDGTTNYLYREIMVPANVQTGVVKAFSYTDNVPFTLQPGYSILASTQIAESFNVIANAQDIINCGC